MAWKARLVLLPAEQLARSFYTENVVFHVRTLVQGFEAVEGGLERACEVFRETCRRGCEQLSTKQERITVWSDESTVIRLMPQE